MIAVISYSFQTLMRKTIYSLLACFCLTGTLYAQDKAVLNDLGLGVSVGTDGLGLEVAVPLGHHIQARTGVNFMPKWVSYKTTVNYGNANNGEVKDEKLDISASLNMKNWRMLVDLYPSRKSTFRFTTGFYWGDALLAKVETSPTPLLRHGGYILLGGQAFGADQIGTARIELRTNSFKPYVGIGFGRAVPHKHRVALSFDMGVQFIGTPRIYGWNDDMLNFGFREVKPDHIDQNSQAAEARKFIEATNKVSVFPVISLRLNGRIF